MSNSISAIPFVQEYAQAARLPVSESLPADCLVLATKPGDPFVERRSVDLQTHSDGSVKAVSFKPFNLLQFSQHKFQLSLLKLLPAAVGVATGSVAVTTVLAVFGFIQTFLEGSQKEFHEQDARVLLSIYKLGSMCHISAIPAEYQRLFHTSVSEDAVRASIDLLVKYRTLRLHPNDEVEIKESINLSRQ